MADRTAQSGRRRHHGVRAWFRGWFSRTILTPHEPLIGESMAFEVPVELNEGVCSDSNCPCPGTRIPRGTGYVYISQELVDFRRDARSVPALLWKLERIQQQMGKVCLFFDRDVYYPILMCEQGAKLRHLDLEVAAADAKYWWETGLVPLRPTPLAR